MLKVAEDLFFFLFTVERWCIVMQVSPVCQCSCRLTLMLTSISKMPEFIQGGLYCICNTTWSMTAFFVYILSVSGKNSLFDEVRRLIVGNDLVSNEAFPLDLSLHQTLCSIRP